MTKQFVYVVCDGRAGNYSKMALLSIGSLRRQHSDAVVYVIAPSDSARDNYWVDLLYATADRVIKVDCPNFEPKLKSRFLKSSMRDQIDGSFLFLDCDTLVVNELSEVFDDKQGLSVTLDRNREDPNPHFPQWAVPLYQEMGWSYPIPYYNSGVIFVPDTDSTRRFFKIWNEFWQSGLSHGVFQDQPSFNAAIQHSEVDLSDIGHRYNAMVDARPDFAKKALIWHFFTSGGRPNQNTVLAAMLDHLVAHKEISWVDFDRCVKQGHPWRKPYEAWALLQSGNHVRAAIAKVQKLCGLNSIQ